MNQTIHGRQSCRRACKGREAITAITFTLTNFPHTVVMSQTCNCYIRQEKYQGASGNFSAEVQPVQRNRNSHNMYFQQTANTWNFRTLPISAACQVSDGWVPKPLPALKMLCLLRCPFNPGHGGRNWNVFLLELYSVDVSKAMIRKSIMERCLDLRKIHSYWLTTGSTIIDFILPCHICYLT